MGNCFGKKPNKSNGAYSSGSLDLNEYSKNVRHPNQRRDTRSRVDLQQVDLAQIHLDSRSAALAGQTNRYVSGVTGGNGNGVGGGGRGSRSNSQSNSRMNGVVYQGNEVAAGLPNTVDEPQSSYASNVSRATTVTSQTSTSTSSGVQVGGKNGNTYKALFEYKARTELDLGFNKGDILYINSEDKKSNGWWLATCDGKRGFIPSQYVALVGSLEAQPWYFGNTKRMEAEKLLYMNENSHGSFLIRNSDTPNSHAYSLSVRDHDTVKHYRIRSDQTGSRLFITKRSMFAALSDLVEHYSAKADGLSVQLAAPCLKIPPITVGLTYSFMNSYEVDRKQFKLVRRIGQGQFGDVWQGEFLMNGMKVAIKTLKEGMNAQDFRAEADLMKQLFHPKLIQLYALCTNGDPIYIVTELMVNGSLLDYLQTPTGKRLNVESLIYIASQIADGMAFLESRNYIHRDLAARNVLVGENNEVKVADFGLARLVKENAQNIYAAREGTKFPIKWTAPEAAIYNKFSIKSDVWSFGITLSEIVTYGRTPYPSMTNQEVLTKVSGTYRMPQPPNCPDKLYSIMMQCWRAVPEERPTFETLRYKLESFFDENDDKPYRDTTHHHGQR